MKAENIIGPASIVHKPERSYLGIRFETPFEGMFAVVTIALKELRKWSNANGLADEGPYFLRYYQTDMKGIMDVEVGLMTNSGWPGAHSTGYPSGRKVCQSGLPRMGCEAISLS